MTETPKNDKVNILLVDDQPAKIMSYEVILQELGENLINATSGRAALEQLLKHDVAVILVDVSMPDLDGFELAAMIRSHPRFEETAIIFVSAVHLSDIDRVRGYEMGAVDYVPVPVIPEVLRAKVRIFVDLYRKTRELEALNDRLEQRVTERTQELKTLNERQSVLAREVDHRAKNALAIVQSIVRLTKAGSVATYIEILEGRIAALSRAHALLSNSRWEGAKLRQLIEDELAPYRTDRPTRIVIDGPDILLEPVAAQSLALAVHELATNAAKYGSLSTAAGDVQVSLELIGDGLSINWVERGGPSVSMPSGEGFGVKLIEASIGGQLDGRAEFAWQPEGLVFSLQIPLSDGFRPANRERPEGLDVAEAAPGNRVLLVEDEALIGMMMADILADLGFEVVGPVTRVSDAVSTARQGTFDSAVLDVNLRGELVYPVAEVLRKGGVPFIFITGYSADRIEERFANVPVLQKPLQKDELQSALAEVRTMPWMKAEPRDRVRGYKL
jgi:two-component sensor histidine kinase/two-component SAPR family response regulator